MKAILMHGYGNVDQLRYEDVPRPEPGLDEVQVRVISTSVNPVDYKIRSGAFKQQMPLDFPIIPGRDVAGEVTAVGPGVTQFTVGDQVMGMVNHSYAEYLIARTDALTRIPEGLDPRDAGVLPLVTETGAQLIENGVQPKSGDLVLVTGAVGSVGRTAVFVAKEHGARVIAGVRASQKNEARSLGADMVVAIDDDKEIDSLPEVDEIADTVNGTTLSRLIPKVKKSGRIASVLGKPEEAERAGIEARGIWAQPDPERLHGLAEAVRDGKLKIPITKRMPLSKSAEAQQAAEKGTEGKIALLP